MAGGAVGAIGTAFAEGRRPVSRAAGDLMSSVRSHSPFTLLLALAITAPAAAQSTFVVDAQGRPGAHFTSIDAAIPAVPPGSVLIVRDGTYARFDIDRPLTIDALPGAVVDLPFTFQVDISIATAGTVVIDGLAITGAGNLHIDRCAGTVVLAGVSGSCGFIEFTDCADVSLVDCQLQVVSLIGTRSRLQIIDSAVRTRHGPRPALDIDECVADIARCVLGPTEPRVRVSPAPTIEARSSIVRIRGNAAHPIEGGSVRNGSGSAGPVISTVLGRMTIDPQIPIRATGLTPFVGTPPEFVEMPSLSVRRAPLGAATAVEIEGMPSAPYAVVLGLPAPPVQVPGIHGALDLDTTAPVLTFSVGILMRTGQVSIPHTFATNPSFVGVPFRWQALTLAPSGLWLSNATTTPLTR